MSFEDQLAEFVRAWIAAEREKREVELTVRRCEAEIRWCLEQIAKEEIRARKQPRAARRVEDLAHQIRHREIEIAFAGLPR